MHFFLGKDYCSDPRTKRVFHEGAIAIKQKHGALSFALSSEEFFHNWPAEPGGLREHGLNQSNPILQNEYLYMCIAAISHAFPFLLAFLRRHSPLFPEKAHPPAVPCKSDKIKGDIYRRNIIQVSVYAI